MTAEMKTKILTFVSGAAIGALAMFLATRPGTEPGDGGVGGGSQAQSIHPDRQQQKVAALKNRIAELEEAQLRPATAGDPDPSGDIDPKTSVKIFGANGSSQLDLAEMQKHIEEAESERAAKRVAADLASLSTALGLRDDQLEQVRTLLERRATKRAGQIGGVLRLATSTLAGEDTDEMVSGLIKEATVGLADDPDAFDFDGELLALVDEGQADAYRDYQHSQNENHIEANANGQLARLQTAIPDLSKEQKDQAFNEFARIAREDIEAGGTAEQGMHGGFNVGRMLAQREAENQAMKGILSPEQFEVFKSNSRQSITFGAPAGATIITSEIVVDPDLGSQGIDAIESE